MKTISGYSDVNKVLIEGCRKNDRKSQYRIYELYYKAMYNTSFRIVNNEIEAEDIMQDAFLDAFQKLDSLQENGSFGVWLKKIVVNKSLDHLRKMKKLSLFEDATDLPEQPNEVDDSYAETVFIRLEQVAKAIENLPDNYRIILSLYLLEGYDQQEIAEILQLSYNNVRTRYLRAKQRLLNDIQRNKNDYLKVLKN